MNFSEREKEILSDAISHYYVNYVYTEFKDKEGYDKSSDLDYEFRTIIKKLDIYSDVNKKNMKKGYQF